MNADLNDISTVWADLAEAHQGPAERARAAQARLLARYEVAIRRYIAGAIHDPESVDEVYQNFAVRFVRGDFQNANPQKGRFRTFLKAAIWNLVTDYFRERKKQGLPLTSDQETAISSGGDDDEQFLEIWRAELIQRAWAALAREEHITGRPLYTLLSMKASDPNLRSITLAQRLEVETGRPVSVEGVRKRLHDARQRFITLFVNEVANTLKSPSFDDIEEELASLGMLDRCRAEMEQRRRRAAGP